MVLSNDVWMPSQAELEIPEIGVTTVPLMAAGHQLGRYCDYKCKELMLCHQESLKDPRRCLAEGKAVTECGLEFFRKIKRSCALPFERYLNCFEKRSGAWNEPRKCLTDQIPFDDCVRQHLGQERPPSGFFSKIRLHDSPRARFPIPPAPMPQRIEERDLDSVQLRAPDVEFAYRRYQTGEDIQRQARDWLKDNRERSTVQKFMPPSE